MSTEDGECSRRPKEISFIKSEPYRSHRSHSLKFYLSPSADTVASLVCRSTASLFVQLYRPNSEEQWGPDYKVNKELLLLYRYGSITIPTFMEHD
ncbi:hypothetical protein GWI33_015838 [Rhynchophorus ferrugineus]|uniref:Uncharacterized protein n=1 Tax=Rhynchophorus ferrugineus TaxID=354439 RepID=A0A834I3F4_RHYFE|nr:hypothetical protein GWI33_015838 [Rhynchophorus ferrugineus]